MQRLRGARCALGFYPATAADDGLRATSVLALERDHKKCPPQLSPTPRQCLAGQGGVSSARNPRKLTHFGWFLSAFGHFVGLSSEGHVPREGFLPSSQLPPAFRNRAVTGAVQNRQQFAKQNADSRQEHFCPVTWPRNSNRKAVRRASRRAAVPAPQRLFPPFPALPFGSLFQLRLSGQALFSLKLFLV